VRQRDTEKGKATQRERERERERDGERFTEKPGHYTQYTLGILYSRRVAVSQAFNSN
jgi:hypothetical protein